MSAHQPFSELLPLLALAALLAGMTALQAGGRADPAKPVPRMELQRLAGTWYEVARLPNMAQVDCASDVTTHYQPRRDGSLQLTQSCRTPTGRLETEVGRAWAAHRGERHLRRDGALKVSFMPRWLQWLPAAQGDRWVVMLDPDYRYAVVSEPSRHHLWVLSRLPTLPADQFGRIVDRLAAEGYPTGQLVLTRQSAGLRGAA